MTNPLNPKPRSHQEPYECGCPNKAKKEGETRENPRRRRGIERYGRIMGRKDEGSEGNTKGPGTRGAKNNQSQLKSQPFCQGSRTVRTRRLDRGTERQRIRGNQKARVKNGAADSRTKRKPSWHEEHPDCNHSDEDQEPHGIGMGPR